MEILSLKEKQDLDGSTLPLKNIKPGDNLFFHMSLI